MQQAQLKLQAGQLHDEIAERGFFLVEFIPNVALYVRGLFRDVLFQVFNLIDQFGDDIAFHNNQRVVNERRSSCNTRSFFWERNVAPTIGKIRPLWLPRAWTH
jgi:hypothetical protein